MKLNIEVEIDESAMAEIVKETIFKMVHDRAHSYLYQRAIADRVTASWDSGLQAIVDKQMANCDVLRNKVANEMQRQIKNRLHAAIRASEKKFPVDLQVREYPEIR